MNDLDFDLNLLPVILAVIEERSVSRAALRLGWSQPKVSIALNKLRTALGDPLFIRGSHGVEPTPRALSLMEPTQEILQRIRQNVLLHAPYAPAASTRAFTFALSDVGEMFMLPQLMRYLAEVAPHVSVTSVTLPPDDIANGLEKGEIDLAVGYFPDLTRRNFYQQRLYSHSFISLIRAGHRIKDKRLSMEQFLELGHAVVRPEGRSHEAFEQVLAKLKIKRRIALSVPHFMSIPFIVASTDLLVTVPAALGERFATLADVRTIYPPMELPTVDLKQHWHRKYHRDEANIWIRSVFLKMFSNGPML
ncbi:LysR family transcriptional regulator [Herbaspirillum sp. SJZ099]|uniref:LysR family transcriptional regulator n=1 Tax=Herbaspirillum sp. SJZ099 TaxID=2572916 RepID=UPI00119E7895|nr:LysR family transcriptional regulator [Herbaspirillum sp. SJZ099]TWC65112.1 DNA-binding transcriptional LysR family regulator [Herbaspirillum sp. SJZ099]